MTKLLDGLNKQLDNLLEESEDIFFAERLFLEDPNAPKVITEDERREMNTLEKQEVCKAIDKEVAKKLPIKAPEPKQESLL